MDEELLESHETDIDAQPILASKLRPPNLNKVLLRPRLLEATASSDNGRMINICAGPGFGKTTLLVQIVQAFQGNSVWYQVDNLDRDPAVLVRHLAEGIAHAGSINAERTRARLNEHTDFRHEGKSIFAVLMDEYCEQCNEPLLICFDDYHLFDDDQSSPLFIDSILRGLPEHISIAIASRTLTKPTLGRLRSQIRSCEIGESDLQFSVDEMSALMEEWGIDVTDESLQKVHKSTEGWAAGLVLTENYLRSGNEAPDLFAQRRLQQNVYEYLAEEVLQNQPAQTQDLLIWAAMVDPIDPEVCKEAIGHKDAGRILAEAEANNLFTSRVHETDYFRYHPLFRDFLISRLKLENDADTVNRMRVRFAEVFVEHGKNEEAIELYLAAGFKPEAIELIEKVGNTLLRNGRHERVANWLEALGEDHGSTALSVLSAKILIENGRVREALRILLRVRQYLGQDDCQVKHDCSLAYAECMRTMNNIDEAVNELETLLEMSLTPQTRLEALQLLGINQSSLRNIDAVHECAQTAEAISIANGNPPATFKAKYYFQPSTFSTVVSLRHVSYFS